MSSVQYLREVISERLTAAAEEIFTEFEKTIVRYEEEIDRQRRLLDNIWKPQITLQIPEPPQKHVCMEEKNVAVQQLCNQERNSSLDQEEPVHSQIKKEQEEPCISVHQEDLKVLKIEEEQKELCTSLEQEQLVLQQETDFSMVTPTYEDHSAPEPNNNQLLSHNSPVAESRGPEGSSETVEPPSKKVKLSEPAKTKKTALTQKERDSNRQIKAEWFDSHKWLLYDKEKDNIFTKGKDASVPKKDDLTRHQKTEDHQLAAGGKQASLRMLKARTSTDNKAKESIVAAMKATLWMAQEDVPNVKFGSLVDLQLENGAKSLRILEKEDGSFHYTHHTSVEDLRACMVAVVEEEMLMEVQEAELYSLEAVEAIDCANKSVLIVYIRYLGHDGTPKVRFLGVRELEMTTSDAIAKTLHRLLEAKGLNKSKMVGLATDGASVMTGVNKGITTQFRREVPFLVTSHCMAHRLQLAAEKAANQVPLIGKYIETLNCFASAVKFSAKLIRTIEQSQKLHTGQTKKIKEAFFTRRLSLCDGTQAIAGCIPAVLSALEKATTEGKAKLRGLANDMGSYKFIYLTHFLADAVGLLGILSKLMQVATPTYQHLKDGVDNAVVSLLALKEVKGTCGFLEKLDGTFPATAPSSGKSDWEDHFIKDTAKQREQVKEAVDLFLEMLVTHLQSTFPDHDVMSSFDIFQPSLNLPKKDVKDKLDKLLWMYGRQKKKGRVTHERLVDPDAAKTEWKLLSPVIPKYSTMKELYTSYVRMNSEAYPNLSKLLQIVLTVTVTSVNCERGVSRYTAIKTSARNCLKVESMDELITLSLEAPPYKEFPYDLSFRMWHLNRNRRAYRQMLRAAEEECKNDEINIHPSILYTPLYPH
ncbi:zinc finger MYM-type protein 1-like isoform X2 [Acanthochromis polyacanthus]|uniref:zinc finger MYM-type protein 1-like isoform X2 n=1 Tax=Acanthochromis polyacanthus TaxID=80966 RepID=UPI0022345536|nr:zinc finger MYM-type protein 1-like isoform X2 [Acanthochromis polyacanthus]